MLVNIDEDTALDMLVDRVKFWNDDEDIVALFSEYYSSCIDEGVFDGGDFNVMMIVDNDYVNWFRFGTLDEIKDDFGDNFTEDNIYARYKDLVLYYAC